MNENSALQTHALGSKPQLTRVTHLLRRTKDSLHGVQGQSPTYLEMAEWTETAEGTIKYWFNNQGHPTAEFLLQLLERVPGRARHEIFDSACRAFPSLEHPYLKCDQAVISLLKTIVRHPRGLVFIQGGTDESRTFLLTALGHAFLGLTPKPRSLAGIDAHAPDWFVPLPGVKYLDNLFHRAKLMEAARGNWPRPQAPGAQLVVFNGLEAVMADFHGQVKALTARCAVIMAEAGHIKPAVLKRWSSGPLHIVTVSKHLENSNGIAIHVEAR